MGVGTGGNYRHGGDSAISRAVDNLRRRVAAESKRS